MKKVTRKLVALIALAVAVGASLTPARALVPAASARGHDESGLVIKTDWASKKKERLARNDPAYCKGHNTDRAACEDTKETLGHGYKQVMCKWQSASIFPKHSGYCYPATKEGHR
jgi:hypothetical protein